jgi:hypothetical protein
MGQYIKASLFPLLKQYRSRHIKSKTLLNHTQLLQILTSYSLQPLLVRIVIQFLAILVVILRYLQTPLIPQMEPLLTIQPLKPSSLHIYS